MRRLVLAFTLAAMPALAQGPGWIPGQTAELQALDKVTARISTIEARVGQTVRFGTLEIEVAACHRRPPDEQPDAAAWLTVKDNRLNGQRVFAGWMFAASPALNMLEHAVYDLRVLECR
ncbi:DUF2155 domain-containing protein [Elioraea tepidiphila]|jgi:hypothetical protein|uniref:DUF2155 domain-containing protein n=1 Tax=Elioraea tepidiphila TaxID=457934 RepID=UPI00035F85E8|nr:DUF2155 domain-containing protein [Elioraea tepidiphila]